MLSRLRCTFVFYTLTSVKLGCIFQSMAWHHLINSAFPFLVVHKIMVHLTITGFLDSVKHNSILPIPFILPSVISRSTHINGSMLKKFYIWIKLQITHRPSESPRIPLTYRHFTSPTGKTLSLLVACLWQLSPQLSPPCGQWPHPMFLS